MSKKLLVAAALAVAVPSCAPAAVAVGGTAIGGGLIAHAMLKHNPDDCHGTPACGLGAAGELAEPMFGVMIVLTSLVTAVALLL
ncbi:MAG TPA: hypothetical protein VGG74_04770 [Kofleriaceae bacterium]